MGRFQDQTVLVTGASGQIGAACAAAYLAEGAYVVGVDAAPVTLEGERAVGLREDLTDAAAIARAFDAAESAFGPVSVVAQCAAGHGRTDFLEHTAEVIDRVLAINVKATLLVGREAAARMIAAGIEGAIVNLTSISGLISHAESVVYEASKGAVTMATKGMANALAPHGIRVNAVGPGLMLKAQEIDEVRGPTDLSDYERQRVPLGRLGTGAEIAEAVLFLSSPAASYTTGTVLYADGGALSAWAAFEETT
ncbi:MAG: SDR family oxidoreductase [Solirubrobacteraceae bacterium]|nr:SDR family oxidoreductase [Solirubrobacteraceae bacterium]